ncbi:condensation domain-containing protein, partial [Nonomuraea lactucae]|uniref:condensation domain-containing protein n=1 Tax=Nonomuraea lactucae TaxID=2249762 RepID=UPI001F057FE4
MSGAVLLTPIQHWFVGQDIADRDHWNWSGMFELAQGADASALARAVDAVVAHHDALRIRFVYDPVREAWAQRIVERELAEIFSVVDAVGMVEAQVAERMTLAQTSLSLADGPLIRVVYFDRGEEPGWLGITVHHLVMDGVSWNVLLEDLDSAYRGEPLPAKTTSFQQWAERLHAYAGTERVREQLPYWTQQLEAGFTVPVDHVSDIGTDEVVRVSLDAETTSALLTRVHRAYRTQINDVLLAGLSQALGEWAGNSAVTIDLESHGREAVAEDVDVSRTVGWFTSIFPVRLAAPDLADPATVLKSVKEQLRGSPDRGVGYGALRYVTGELGQVADRQVLFNYMGGADVAGDEAVGLLVRELSPELCGSSGETGSHVLQIEAFQTADGEMAFEWYFCRGLHRAETIERVAESYVRALRALVEHCLSPGAGGFTPSDFALVRLDQAAVDALPGGGRIQDVYPLAPVQQGMLFHVVEAPADGRGVYWAQGVYEFTGALDARLLRQAWDVVVQRHAALRTGFVWEGVPEPVQVVYDRVEVPFEVVDWSAGGDWPERLEELLAADRGRGFDLARPPLMRVYLVDRGDDRYWMVWCLYQGVCDGWSLPVVMEEVTRSYEALCRDEQPALPPAGAYRDFVAWLQRQESSEAEAFWREYLAGFETPTALPVDRQVAEHWAQGRLRVELSDEVTDALVALARRARVTLGTVVQAGWALLLSRYSGENDVMFGLTVSGRPA